MGKIGALVTGFGDGSGGMQEVCAKLRYEPAIGARRLRFLLAEYIFFADTQDSGALLLRLPWPFSPFSFMIHVIKTYALALLSLPCYFVRLEDETVGLLAFQEQTGSLLVASIAVAREHRRLGIGTCMLKQVEAVANRMEKRWLEVGVWRRNTQAQRFYSSIGFSVIQSQRMIYIMRKEVSATRNGHSHDTPQRKIDETF